MAFGRGTAGRRGDCVVAAGQVGQAILDLVAGSGYDQDAYVLTGAGLRPLD